MENIDEAEKVIMSVMRREIRRKGFRTTNWLSLTNRKAASVQVGALILIKEDDGVGFFTRKLPISLLEMWYR